MRIFKSIFIFIILGVPVVGCNDTGGEEGGGFVPTGSIIAVAERSGSNQTIKVGGTTGAVPPGSLVEVTNINTDETQVTVGEHDGSFDPTFMGNTNDSFNVLVTDNGVVVEDTDIGVTLLSQAVTRNIERFLSAPTNLVIRGNRAYVLTFLNTIEIFDLEQNPPIKIGNIDVPPNSDPVSMAFLDDTHAYVVNNIGQSVAMVNVQTRQCELIIANTGMGNNFPPCQEVRLVASGFEDPSDVAIANGKVYVSNNNLDENFEPQGPGFISVIDAETNQFIDQFPASGANTGGMTIINDNIYVVNAGDISSSPDFSEFFCDFDLPPSIDIIDPQLDDIIDTINIPLSEGNPKVCLPNKIAPTPDERFGYMGLGIVGAMLKVDLENNTVINGTNNPIVLTDLSSLNLIGDIEINQDGIGFASIFDNDQVAVFDSSGNQTVLNPFPFIAPFPAGSSSSLLEGVQSIAIRSGSSGIDFQGADVFFTTTVNTSFSLGSINTASILPPR
ncbi:MAG: hypothetical protein WBD99_11205 [Thermodesulfobacteriota bacterium]